ETEIMDSESTHTDEFRYHDGRRYHNVKDAVYPLPNDEDEQDRQHLQHFLMRYLWQSNFSAPINHILAKPGAKILDIGCGAGSWSFDMATTYPTSNVFGLDISPHQPTQIEPENFKYVKANVLEGIPFEDNIFDLVYQRFLSYAYTKDNWEYVMNEIVRVLKPGGFLEACLFLKFNLNLFINILNNYINIFFKKMMEPSPHLFDAGPVTQRLMGVQSTLMTQRGVDLDLYQNLEKLPQNQGQLENIEKEVKIIRHGVKSNDIQLNKVGIDNLISIMAGMKSHTTRILQIFDDEFDEMLKAAEKELYESDFYYYLVRVYACKVVSDNNQ
ncbi:8977_t:CDS:2, partial [Dentiscutata erythropus]